jgi:hypothetical protein
MMDEIWLPVNGFEGSYEVSNLGRVRSLDRVVNGRWGKPRFYEGKFMAQRSSSTGYALVSLSRPRERQQVATVHRLVAIAFIPNPEGKPQVNHVDGVKTNNNVKNLEWSTNQENVTHAYRIGLSAQGVDHPAAKLTPELIQKAKELRETGHTYAAIGRMFGLNYTVISKALRGVSWKHLF